MTPVLDLVVPVYNEEVALLPSVRRLHAHLAETFPYPFRITIADNASTDRTPSVAARAAAELPGVEVVRLEEKGRGRALRAVWSASDALLLAYVDVDLSTDLDALWPLLAPLLSGHSDLAIGTRLHRDSRVVRGPRREVISRCYNLSLRVCLAARFSDAQCGFKAVRADVATELLPMTTDDAWFFDTELLVLAQRCGLRIHEVPVDWWDDPDSRVDVVRTAADDLRGMLRMRRQQPRLAARVGGIRQSMGRTSPAAATGTQLVRFALVGVLTTLVHLGLFAWLSGSVDAQRANLVALLLATVVNTALNRRWSFGTSGRGRWWAQVQGLGVLALTWLLTSAALATLAAVDPHAPARVQTVVLGVAALATTSVKFLLMRSWMFARRSGPPAPTTGRGSARPAEAPTESREQARAG